MLYLAGTAQHVAWTTLAIKFSATPLSSRPRRIHHKLNPARFLPSASGRRPHACNRVHTLTLLENSMAAQTGNSTAAQSSMYVADTQVPEIQCCECQVEVRYLYPVQLRLLAAQPNAVQLQCLHQQQHHNHALQQVMQSMHGCPAICVCISPMLLSWVTAYTMQNPCMVKSAKPHSCTDATCPSHTLREFLPPRHGPQTLQKTSYHGLCKYNNARIGGCVCNAMVAKRCMTLVLVSRRPRKL